MSKLKTIYINARFLTQETTGVQRFALEMSRELKVKYDQVVFLAPRNILNGEIANELGVKTLGYARGHFWEQWTLQLYIIYKRGFLISFCNTAPLFLRNQIITIHDLGFKMHPEWFSKSFSMVYNFLIPRIAKKALHVITVSESSKKEIVNELVIPAEKVSVIYNAVAPIFFKDQNIEVSTNNLLKNKYLLTVSSHHPRKNFERLIDAFKMTEDKELYLYIIGNFNKHFANKFINYEANKRIRFLTNISDTELVWFYKHATLFVYPSLYEGFGIPIIEALSQQKPVSVSDIPVFREVCGNHATYFDPRSSFSIKKGIQKGLENENNFKKQNDNLISRYSWNSSAAKFIEIIDKFK